ncbi:MAG: MFS transporter [Betaproteobacteria bacterium SG8_40]|nr:MAG: MFS transporter [Betaproteobacteria bacterium SG8_40]
MSTQPGGYYLPSPSHWPIFGSIALFLMAFGGVLMMNGAGGGTATLVVGVLVMIYMLVGWFGTVIGESESGKYNKQVDVSFRWGMSWFIFSEVMFFAAFFGALFYMRVLSVPWLADADTAALLWPGFTAEWPASGPAIAEQFTPMGAWGLPAINTAILLTSGVTITIAHWALKENKRSTLNWFMFLTIALGLTFIAVQAYEYGHAYKDLNLTLESGAYGATFFMLTGFHGFHVTVGTIMLIVIWLRCLKGHFKPENHFGFEGVAWYWHFVDVVWLGLFVFVYWL